MLAKRANALFLLQVPLFFFFLCGFTHSLATTTTTTMNPQQQQQQKKIAIIGASGRLGRQAVLELQSRKIPVRCLLRNDIPPQTKPSIEIGSSSAQVNAYLNKLDGVEMVKADLADVQSLEVLFRGCHACLALHGAGRQFGLSDLLPWTDPESDPSHAKQTNFEGVKNIIQAAKNSKGCCKRIVRITGKGENPWSIFSILINGLGGMAKAWNYEGERLLRDSNIEYTIIRPGIMGPKTPDGAVLALADNGADLKVSAVRYDQIANLCVECLDYDNASRSTLCAMNVPEGEGETSYAPLLAKVRPDTRVFPSNMFEESRKAVRTGAIVLATFVSLGLAAVVKGVLGLLGLVF